MEMNLEKIIEQLKSAGAINEYRATFEAWNGQENHLSGAKIAYQYMEVDAKKMDEALPKLLGKDIESITDIINNAKTDKMYQSFNGVHGTMSVEKSTNSHNHIIGAYIGSDQDKLCEDVLAATVSYATGLGKKLVINRDLPLVSNLKGDLEVHGNVGMIIGKIGSNNLKVYGGVKSLSTYSSGFSRSSPATKYEGTLEIYGDLEGYKTCIDQPGLSVKIHGNVTTENAFIYRASRFKQLEIYGNVSTKQAQFCGLYEGDVVIHGNCAFNTEEYARLDPAYRNGNISIRGIDAVKDGKKQLVKEVEE